MRIRTCAGGADPLLADMLLLTRHAGICTCAYAHVQVAPIPCWQTCWETMTANASAKHATSPSCLAHDAPPAGPGGVPGPSCATREVYCTPACGTPTHSTLASFWSEWERQQPAFVAKLGIECRATPGLPGFCGGGG